MESIKFKSILTFFSNPQNSAAGITLRIANEPAVTGIGDGSQFLKTQ